MIDKNLSPRLIGALHRHNPTIDVVRVGDPGAPRLHTLDPEILLYCEVEQRLLVTDNRTSMPRHVADHLHWGVFRLRYDVSVGPLAAELYFFWSASEAEEWVDRMEWIPY